jgi:hypothetical protein
MRKPCGEEKESAHKKEDNEAKIPHGTLNSHA